jgi:hypothetical protein
MLQVQSLWSDTSLKGMANTVILRRAKFTRTRLQQDVEERSEF